MPKININSKCICGSDKIYKYCCSLIIHESNNCEKCGLSIKYDMCYRCDGLKQFMELNNKLNRNNKK